MGCTAWLQLPNRRRRYGSGACWLAGCVGSGAAGTAVDSSGRLVGAVMAVRVGNRVAGPTGAGATVPGGAIGVANGGGVIGATVTVRRSESG